MIPSEVAEIADLMVPDGWQDTVIESDVLSAARRKDKKAMADMIEAMTNSLGLTIAIAAHGDPKAAQELLSLRSTDAKPGLE
jgi:hypothetical protein